MRTTPLFALAVVVIALFTQLAPAQGTSELFPDPMSSAEAEAAIDRIGLTGDAKVRALKAFEEYVDRFLTLRKGDIDEYLEARGQVGSTPSREDVAARVDKRRSLLRRIHTIENQFFDQMAADAGDEYAVSLARERARAERRRDWAASSSFTSRGSRIELADLVSSTVGDATLPPETSTAVDAALKTFEDQATALARRLLEVAVTEPTAMYDARAAAGIPQQPRFDAEAGPNAFRDYFDALEKVRAQVREKQIDIRGKIRANARNSAKTLTKLLPPEFGPKFHQSFIERAYPNVARPRDPVPSLLKEAEAKLESGEITKEEFAQVEELAANHARNRTELDDRMMNAADKEALENAATGLRFRLIEEETAESERSDLERLAESRNNLDNATAEAIGGTARALAKPKSEGQDGANEVIINGMHLDIPEGLMEEGGGGLVVMTTGDDIGGGGNAVVSFAMSSDELSRTGTPAPLNRADVDALKAQFNLSGDEATVVDLLFEDYQSKWHEIEEGELAELHALPSTLPGGNDSVAPSDRDVSRQFQLRRGVLERALALEREFVEGFGAALSSKVSKEAAEALRRWRERSAYLTATAGGGGFMIHMSSGGSSAATLDLVAIARDAKLAPDALAAAKSPLEAWDATSVDALKNRFEVHFAAQRLRADMDAKLAAQAIADGHPGQLRIESENDEVRKVQVAEKKANDADRLVEGMNKQALDAVLAALPDDAARQALRDTWDRKAWPSIFRDRRDVEPFIGKALALADLTADQKVRIAAVASEHRTDYRRVCQEMIDANEKAAKPDPQRDGEGFDFRVLQARQEAMNRLRFERNELNEKTLRRVKEVLTAAQSEKIGDLPKASAGSGFSFGPGGGTSEVRMRKGGPPAKKSDS